MTAKPREGAGPALEAKAPRCQHGRKAGGARRAVAARVFERRGSRYDRTDTAVLLARVYFSALRGGLRRATERAAGAAQSWMEAPREIGAALLCSLARTPKRADPCFRARHSPRREGISAVT